MFVLNQKLFSTKLTIDEQFVSAYKSTANDIKTCTLLSCSLYNLFIICCVI